MWTSHAGPHGARAPTRTAKSNSESATGTSNLISSSRIRPAASQHQYTVSTLEAENYADFFEPAVEGPPSPAVIRAFNDKVKQSSVSYRHVNEQTTSSGSSPPISYASHDRRPSWEQTWEQALDSFTLSRKSSVKSTTSSMPSKERPESVQAIGKAIFNRKSKFRRESLNEISTGDLTPPEMPTDRSRALSSISKETLLGSMSIFSRRKTVQAGDEVGQKKPLISSPYNFQHVAQIHRDQLPALQRADQSTLHNELASAQNSPALSERLSEDLHVPDFASGRTMPREEDDSVPPHVVLHSRENSTSRPPSIHKSHPRQWIKQAKSQDQIRGTPPPRPPRSPSSLNMGYFDFAPPAPPSRNPSRPSIPRRDSEALPNPGRQHSTAAAAFRFPSPLVVQEEEASSPAVSPGAHVVSGRERRFSHLFVPAEIPNWPLSAPLVNSSSGTFEAALPEVPEEEEQSGFPSRSGPAVKSTLSSLKGSISVPALRKSSLSNASSGAHDRNVSRDSVVLGALDMSTFRQIAECDISNRAQDLDALRRDSWEAVIDYAYEHEMEADCEYDWHRPSVHLDHEPTVLITDSGDDSTIMSRPPSDCLDLPVLSPSHHLSPQSSQEVITPVLASASGTRSVSPTRANFSLPRRERPQRLLHVRSESQTSFIEAQGFCLSPSFLIPTDYHQEVLARKFQQDASAADTNGTANHSNRNELFIAARASGSTTASHSNLSSERHISATSSNTDYTRLTMSVSSVDLEGFNFKDDAVSTPTSCYSGGDDEDNDELPAMLPPTSSHSHSRSRSAQSPSLQSAAAAAPGGRARSKTLSSTPPGGFSLFPSVASPNKAPPRF